MKTLFLIILAVLIIFMSCQNIMQPNEKETKMSNLNDGL